MAARPCSTCGASRNSGVHLRTSSGYHAYTDARGAARLAPQSSGRTEYMRSAEHKAAYEHVEGECIFFAGGAPLECYGPITPGHVVSRTVAGSLQEADRWPVAPQCARHNTDVDADPELREWAETHFFQWHDGKFYRYRYNRAAYERELLATERA